MQLQMHSNVFLLQFLDVLNRANVLLYFVHKNFTFVKIFIKLFTRYLGNKLNSLKPSVKSTTTLKNSSNNSNSSSNKVIRTNKGEVHPNSQELWAFGPSPSIT